MSKKYSWSYFQNGKNFSITETIEGRDLPDWVFIPIILGIISVISLIVIMF